ncbi:putative iron-sulfur cluster-binding metallochaperone [Magnetococcus sp. PR-3]|uniref:putative iron-sulfur cluster-binding metallochaperone n=1 Tax=Magnetococcus sp. PR-3 TaxID=3120355 RepID=UPI002FCE42C7
MTCCSQPQSHEEHDINLCNPTKPPCPTCKNLGSVVKPLTPKHTLKAEFRSHVNEHGHYHFCESPSCPVVYYDALSESVFTQDQLINRVTIKDDHPKTPLCYCFKVLKEDALKELAQQGTTDVIAMIQERMKKHGCQCEKLNPRGGCCLQDIKQWLAQQGIHPESQSTPSSGCGCGS